MKPKAPKRKTCTIEYDGHVERLTECVTQTCPHCGNEGYYCDDIESANPVKRKPLPKGLVERVRSMITALENDGHDDVVFLGAPANVCAKDVRELLRRAGGGK